MRYQEILETLSRPSQALLEATMRWVLGWKTETERTSIEHDVLSVRSEGIQFSTSKYGKLYRAQSLSDEQVEALRHGNPISITVHRLTSWSTLKRVATMFLDGDGENMAIIAKSNNLMPILDIMRIARFFDISGMADENEHLSDMMRDAAREREVVCEQIGGPLIINPNEIEGRR